MLLLTRWDTIDLLPKEFLTILKKICYNHSPNMKIKILYKLTKHKNKIFKHVDNFFNNYLTINIKEYNTVENDYCRKILAYCHYMKNVILPTFKSKEKRKLKSKRLIFFQTLEEIIYDIIEMINKERLLLVNNDDLMNVYEITKKKINLQCKKILFDLERKESNFGLLFYYMKPFLNCIWRITMVKYIFREIITTKRNWQFHTLQNQFYLQMNKILQ
ncbi:hypothetical protein ABK040_004848 [Willaertia magna]